MQRFGSEQVADTALKVILAINAFLFLSFLTIIAGAINARADTQPKATDTAIVCPPGKDLLGELEKKYPAKMDAIRREVAEMPNHSGIFWKIEKQGVAPSYLLGTFHLSDPRIATLPATIQNAYDASQTVIVETTDILDPKTPLRIMVDHPELMRFTDGTTLSSHIPPSELEEARIKLEKRGLVLTAVNRMKPWVISTVLALPRCELARQRAGNDVLDQKLARTAQAEGKTLEGLETSFEQLSAMDTLPIEFHMRNLLASLSYLDDMEDIMETIIGLYRKGEIGMIVPALRLMAPDNLDDDDYATFQKVMVTDRNHIMVDRATPILSRGNAFMAVGAMHLPGQEGVIELLKQKGFRLTPVSL